MKSRVLVLFAHPAMEKSRVNRCLGAAVQGLEGVTFHDLYQLYPDLDIDVETEQALLVDHDVIVFQHPFYWYSTPAILKEWQDLVLTHGWAYGGGGTALHGKRMLNAMSAGAREESYCGEGLNRFTIRQLLAPLEQTARLCGMRYLAPFVVHGTHSLTDGQIRAHAEDYRAVLESLRDGTFDDDAGASTHRLNANLDAVIRRPAGHA